MLYAILKSLLIPPGVISLLLIAAFLATRAVLARILLLMAFSLVTLMSLPVVARLVMQPLEQYSALDPAHLPAGAQAILILGGGRRERAPEYGGKDTLDDGSLRRVRYGARLHRVTGLPVYVTGGRFPSEAEPLGDLMAEALAADYGIEVAGRELESRTTWENAAFSAPLLAGDGIQVILLVSDAWHLPRAVEACERNGLRAIPAPTAFVHAPGWTERLTYRDWLPSTRAFSESSYAIHEYLGRLWYQARGAGEGPATGDVRTPAPSS